MEKYGRVVRELDYSRYQEIAGTLRIQVPKHSVLEIERVRNKEGQK